MDDMDSKWPAWYYGPAGEAQVFENADDVPKGWKDHPAKHKGAAPATPATPDAPATPAAPAAPVASTGTEELDAAGWPWTPELHAASKGKTGQGLWRMKVGVTRPAPKITQPLDL